jgi:hypothetical protein
MKDVVGSVFAIFLGFILLLVTPMYYFSIIQWAKAETVALTAARNLIDEVIDTKEMDDVALANFNMELAALSGYYTATVTRQVKVVNPDPLSPGETYTTYMMVDNNKEYDQGDFIIIEIEPLGVNISQTIARTLMGFQIPDNGVVLAGRVR